MILEIQTGLITFFGVETFPMTKIYVLGFGFSEDLGRLALIKKLRPAWQAGLWNGIGGKVEKDEGCHEAMCREFKEETGVQIDDWNFFAKLGNSHFYVYCYRTFNDKILDVKTVEEEEVYAWFVPGLFENKVFDCIPNLKWLIPLALDNHPGNSPRLVTITYPENSHG